MNVIVAVDRHWGIGFQNRLLVRIPEDQKFFRETTTGNVIVMGRKTLESFPNGQPLPNRTNIVLTGKPDYHVKNTVVVHDMDELFAELSRYPSEQIYVIGGGSVYRSLLPYCSVAHVTRIDYAYQADTFFPDLDAAEGWTVTADSEERTYFDLEYTFYKYENRNPLPLPHMAEQT